ncbi:MAG: hypothetical protein M0R46_06640 [Candidatus Muirbacterium halophilum]|nr:hypothetical protein [Candidatus Muirbacterium halophilum]
MSIKLTPKNYVMNIIYERIKENIPYDINLNPYKKEYLLETLKYFENLEEYEKCHIINKFIKERFNHQFNYY